MKNYRLFIPIICFVVGLLSHTKVIADDKNLCNVFYTAIAGTEGFGDAENYPSLVDGDDYTKWCCPSSNAYIIFRASEKIVPTWYRLVTGNDTSTYPERNWKSWKIYGGNFDNDGDAVRYGDGWTLIDDKNGYNLPATNREAVEIDMSNPTAKQFQYFMIEVFETVGSGTMQMSELSFGTQISAISVRKGLITSASQLSSPYSDSVEGLDFGALIDGDINTFWHSDWHGMSPEGMAYDEGFDTKYCHYIQISGMKKLVGKCSLYLLQRMTDNDHPSKVVLMGSNDPNAGDGKWAEMAVLTIPHTGPGEENDVEFTVKTPYEYIRMLVTDCVGTFYGWRTYWHAAEIQLSTTGSIPINPDKNYLSVPSSINIPNGTRFDLPVSMTNEDEISSLQFDLVLPDGFSLATDGNGKAILGLSERTSTNRHAVSYRKLDSGAYRIIIVSPTNKTFDNNSGEILSVGVISSNDIAVGEYTVNIENVVMTNPNAERYVAESVYGILNYAGPVTVTAKSYSRNYGEANPTFEYTVEGAELEGTPEIICEATETSPVGEYPIVIKKGSVTNYNDTYVNGVLTITKAPLKISAGNYTKKQGEANPEFTLSYVGFKNNETKDVLTKQPSVTCEATDASEPGEYPITVSGAEAQNYDISYTNGKLTVVNADAIVITAKSYSREYGEANPTFEYTAEGAELEGTPEIICEATATSPAGEYPIIIKKGSVTNYNDTYVNGVLTITKAPLTVSVGNYTKKQYDPMPEFSVTYKGFKNDETEDVLTKKPTISCDADENSVPDEYDITVSGAEAENYTMKYVNGTLTVTEPDSYKLTYMVDGEEYKSFSVKFKEAITPLEEPTKEGYTFSGWSEIPETMPDHDVTVTGSFTINSYTLTYMVDGEVYKSYTVEYGTAITPEEEPTKEGYTFSGWSEIPETMPAKDVTVTGSFSEGSYTLTYMVDGEVYKTLTLAYGSKITPEKEPTKEGYTFSGWSEIPETMPAKDVTVTGTFSVNSYTLTYKVDGEVYKTLTYSYGSKINPAKEPTKEGYTFSGWSEIPETMPAKDVTVTGTFSVNSYTLTYKVDGEVYRTLTFAYGSKITPLKEPTKEGYTFSGWSEIPETMPAKDVTVTGSFTINSYTITYVLDGEVYTTETLEYGAEIVPPVIPGLEDYTIWEDVPETMPANDVTIYGKAKEIIDGIGSINNEQLIIDNSTSVYDLSGRKMFNAEGVASGQRERSGNVQSSMFNGRRKGINIIRKSDGTVKKVLVK